MIKSSRRFFLLPALLAFAAALFTAGRVLAINAPANFSAKGVSACQINLSWGQVPGVDHYELWRSTISTFYPLTTVTSSTIPSGNTGLGVAGLSTSTQFYFQVEAVDGSGNNSAWASASARTNDLLNPPAAPKFVQAFGKSGNQQIEVDFAVSSPISTYGGWDIEYATSSDGTGFGPWTNVIGAMQPYNATAYIDNNSGKYLNTAWVYQYRLRNYQSDLGCTPAERAYSPYTDGVIVPTTPSSLVSTPYFDPNQTPQNWVVLDWTGGKATSYYEIWRNGGSGYQKIDTTTGVTYTDKTLTVNHTYSYEVRAVNSANAAASGYSDFSNIVTQPVYGAPQNFRANIAKLYQSGGQTVGDVYLTWDNTFPGRDYYVERASGLNANSGFSQLPTVVHNNNANATMSYTDKALPSGSGYTYRVRSSYGGSVYTAYSVTQSVDLNVTALQGFAWAGQQGNGGTSAADPGIGWIKFSPADAPADSVPYGVYMNNTTGALSGYAWTQWNGWLSFNQSDLTGCPSGSCAAQLRNGQLSGWAKFIGADPNQSSWIGWVSLSGTNGKPVGNADYISYGVCLGRQINTQNPNLCSGTATASNQLNGWSWGGDVTGWISWSGTASDGSSYGVNLGGGQSNQGPQNVKVSNVTTNGFTVSWTNPQSYTKVEIRLSFKNPSSIQDKNQYRVRGTFISSKLGGSDDAYTNASTTPISYTVTYLDASSTYGVFVRGYTQ